jgi:hypothetical protein
MRKVQQQKNDVAEKYTNLRHKPKAKVLDLDLDLDLDLKKNLGQKTPRILSKTFSKSKSMTWTKTLLNDPILIA